MAFVYGCVPAFGVRSTIGLEVKSRGWDLCIFEGAVAATMMRYRHSADHLPYRMPPKLPAELSDAIIDHLHNDKAACALVCKGWVPASRHHLSHRSPARRCARRFRQEVAEVDGVAQRRIAHSFVLDVFETVGAHHRLRQQRTQRAALLVCCRGIY